MTDQETQKRMAAEAAVELINDGDVVGLGTGSTVKYVLEALGKKVQQGMKVKGVATSVQTEELAKSLHIPLITIDEMIQKYRGIDIAIDGADHIDESYRIIKGGGGAMHREKIVLMYADMKVIIVDESKMVKKLAGLILPVEVTKFSSPFVQEAITGFEITSKLRLDSHGQPFVTDNGNYILDCKLHKEVDLSEISVLLPVIPGVVDHGLFVNLATKIIVGGPKGVKVYDMDPVEIPSEEEFEKFMMQQLV